VKKVVISLVNDTLKKEGRYSRTSLTMFSAWVFALSFAWFDFMDKGLRFDVWVTLVGVALGSKITDAYSKKIHS
jgi:hypothetical protein